jgi:membrane-associated phospholipid phosphatase
LLVAYWTSGLLFVAPNVSQERALGWLDDRLAIRDVSRRTPRPVAEVLEAAYAGVYLLVPIALLIYLQYSPSPDFGTFWSVVLITDFVCFGVLPWVQTRPPRALEDAEPWASSLRRFNLRLLGATSIQVNTFPSGHAAEGLAAALLVLEAPAGIVIAMLIAALAVSAGAVLGRYHYLADALAGWVVAVAVYVIITK